MSDPQPQSALQLEVARIQSSGALGEARLRKLFDYLAMKTLAGESPKEISIAIDAFGKGPTFDVSQDALVRVYIHKLRKALQGFYASTALEEDAVLDIPRGEYRLRVTLKNSSMPRIAAPVKSRRSRFLFPMTIAGALIIALLVGLEVGRRTAPEAELEQVRANPFWSSILKDDRPIMIVIGDYYLIGDTEGSMEVKRLVREYSINSRSDLELYTTEHPDYADRYLDVGLRYLPISAAVALRNVMVVLAAQNRRITVSKMSDLKAPGFKSADIVYIGYLSGMGMFENLVFTGSRFKVGDSYDEIIDKKTNHSYVSEVAGQIDQVPMAGKEQTYRDYGLFQKLRGPSGNTILVIAGTRDEGVSQTAETVTNAQKLKELDRKVDPTLPLEGLLEVSAFKGTNLTGKLLLSTNRGPATPPP